MSLEKDQRLQSSPERPITNSNVIEYMRDTNRRILPLLRQAVISISDPDSREIIEYFLKPRYDKAKVRPLLTRLAFDLSADIVSYGHPEYRVLPVFAFSVIANLCVAIRLMDAATLIQDDVLDHTPERDGQKSVYKKYGAEKALIAGNITRELANQVFSMAIDDQEQSYDQLLEQLRKDGEVRKTFKGTRGMVFKSADGEIGVHRDINIHKDMMQIFNDIWHLIYIGQLLDNEKFNKGKFPTIKLNEQRTYLLTGSFIERVLQLGALWAGLNRKSDRAFLEVLSRYGRFYGMGLQILNDLLDFAPKEKSTQGSAVARDFAYDDFKEGKQTLPIMLARNLCTPDEWEFIRQRLGKNISREEKLTINRILLARGIIKEVQRQIFEYSKRAIAEIDVIQFKSRSRDMLRVLAMGLNRSVNTDFGLYGPSNEWIIPDSLDKIAEYFE